MTDTTKPIPRDVSDRTLSEDFHTQSPNTQQYVKSMTGGITPTSKSISRITQIYSANVDRFTDASDYEKEMMFRYGLIPPNCHAYNKYVAEITNNAKKE